MRLGHKMLDELKRVHLALVQYCRDAVRPVRHMHKLLLRRVPEHHHAALHARRVQHAQDIAPVGLDKAALVLVNIFPVRVDVLAADALLHAVDIRRDQYVLRKVRLEFDLIDIRSLLHSALSFLVSHVIFFGVSAFSARCIRTFRAFGRGRNIRRAST